MSDFGSEQKKHVSVSTELSLTELNNAARMLGNHFKCTGCGHDLVLGSTFSCAQCNGDQVCELCCAQHLRKGHIVKDNHGFEIRTCDKHFMACFYFCQTCNIVICERCCAFNHKEHAFGALYAYSSQVADFINADITRIRNSLQTFHGRSELVKSFQSKIEELFETYEIETKKVISNVLDVLDSLVMKEHLAHVEWMKELEERRLEMEDWCGFSHGLIHQLKDISRLSAPELVTGYSELQKKCRGLEERRRLVDVSGLEFKPWFLNSRETSGNLDGLKIELKKALPSVQPPQIIERFRVEEVGLIHIHIDEIIVGHRNQVSRYCFLTGAFKETVTIADSVWDISATDDRLFFATSCSINSVDLKSKELVCISSEYCRLVKVAGFGYLTAFGNGTSASIVSVTNDLKIIGTVSYFQGKYPPVVCVSETRVAIGLYESPGTVNNIRLYDEKLQLLASCEHWASRAACFLCSLTFIGASAVLAVAVTGEQEPTARLYDSEGLGLVSERCLNVGQNVKIRSAAFCANSDTFAFCCTDNSIRKLKLPS